MTCCAAEEQVPWPSSVVAAESVALPEAEAVLVCVTSWTLAASSAMAMAVAVSSDAAVPQEAAVMAKQCDVAPSGVLAKLRRFL